MVNIPGYSFVKIEPVDEGLSRDSKYRAETADGRLLLLRLSDRTEYDQVKNKFARMRRMDAADIPMSRPLAFGLSECDEKTYQLLTWCDGDNLVNLLPSMSEAGQYAMGRKAGGILRAIHAVPVAGEDASAGDWHRRYSDFMDESIREFMEINRNMRIDDADLILAYFGSHRQLLKGRPQCYLHNDYHPGNLILSPDHDLNVIDWEILLYNNYGDPWMELNMQETPDFSTGLLHGYFEGEPPEEFWTLQAFYTSVGSLSAIPWAYYSFPDLLESRKANVAEVLRWYDGMRNPVPAWYHAR